MAKARMPITSPDAKEVVARNVIIKRAELDLTQRELAELIGVTQQRIAEIEGGNQNITIETLEAVAKALSCQLEDLVRKS